MTIHLNGKPHDLSSSCSVEELLTSLGLADQPVVVEHNLTALFPREYGKTSINENDRIEIISIAAGG